MTTEEGRGPASARPAPVGTVDWRRRLGDVLLDLGLVRPMQLEVALAQQEDEPGVRLGAVLQHMGVLTEDDVARALSVLHRVPMVSLDELEVDRDVARVIPQPVAERLGLLVHAQQGSRLSVVVADPVDVVALDDVRTLTGATSLQVGVAPRSAIVAALADVWAAQHDREAVRAFVDEAPETADDEADERSEDDAATIRMVDRLMALAARERASDLHVEPQRGLVVVRLRVDGVLREVLQLPLAGYSALVARLKIVAGLDIIERRLPQDGRARIRVPGEVVDARVSTVPTMHGEKVVVRLLPPASRLSDLAGLGLDEAQRGSLLDVMGRPQGLVLITGPTGSGKTNTLYAALAEGVDRTRSVMTLEDPVEIELPGIAQIQVDERSGLTFARGLRACLRQDPDVILVGEIRDQETAELAVRAALTGHLVLSTLHTLDASAALTRLTDMGVAPFLVTSSLALVASQRLVRVPCATCAEPDPDAHAVLDRLGVVDRDGRWLRAVGCSACAQTGYSGRTAVMELLPVTEGLRRALHSGAGEEQVRRAAREQGHPSLQQAGLARARTGATTLAEVLRALPAD